LKIQSLDASGLREIETSIEKRIQDAYDRQLQRRLRETEEKVKAEQKLLYDQKIQEIEDQASLRISVKEQALLEKERNQKERLHDEHELNQKDLYQERQRILHQAEQNQEILRTLDIRKAEQQQLQDNLTSKNIEYENAEIRFQEKVRINKIEALREAENNLKSERLEIENLHNKLKENEHKLAQKENAIKIRETSLLNLEKEHQHGKSEISSLRDKVSALEIRNQTLAYKLEQMHDYESVKELNNLMKAQIDSFPGKGAKDFLNIQKRWCDQVGEMKSLMNRIEKANLELDIQETPKKVDVSIGDDTQLNLPTLDESHTFSVSSFVQEMKCRVDTLEAETKLINEQYNIFRTN